MKKIFTYCVIPLLLIAFCSTAKAQKLESSGKINNSGKIIAKGLFFSSGDSAHVDNKGLIIIGGNAVIGQDTIDGEVQYVKDVKDGFQTVPQITYRTVKFFGISEKVMPLDSSALVSTDTIFTNSFDVRLKMPRDAEIISSGRVTHNGNINAATTYGKFRLLGIDSQAVDGNGIFRQLELDNAEGADVVNSGGFHVFTELDLTRGQFRNDSLNNFSMGDSTLIVRNVNGSLRTEPIFEGRVSVRYYGDGEITSGGELPDDSTFLQGLFVENTRGLNLKKNATVNDSLYLYSKIRTETDADTVVLTLNSLKDPVFGSYDAEIDGSFRRTILRYDSTKMVFNNPYTWALFKDQPNANGARELTFRVKPRTFPPILNGEVKVQRSIYISALDGNNAPVTDGVNMVLGYGWRHTQDTAKDETRSLQRDFELLILQKMARTEWEDNLTSHVPKADTIPEWAYSNADNVLSLGQFAIGLPNNTRLVLFAQVYLEGPYRFGSMSLDLNIKGLIPLTPPDAYPYNLDPNRQLINLGTVPDSVIDYIVLEFRRALTDTSAFYRTCLLKSDGTIVDLDGLSPVVLAKGGLDAGDYYVAVRHRNHLSIITEKPVGLYPSQDASFVDFSNPQNLLGRANALKPIVKDNTGSILFGMIAGDVNGDGIIDDKDHIAVWNDRDYENGYFPADINMSGLINTRDFNYSWNNRDRRTFVP